MKLSIITVSYNAEKCIKSTIESVLYQTKPVFEYILIDGGSNDATYEIICSYRKVFEDKGIIFKCISEKDKGISDAFNKGIERAEGDLVGLINADDELLPDTCQLLSERYSAVQADIYYGNCIWVDDAVNLEYVSKPSHSLEKLLYYMVLIHPSTFVKKKAYQEVGTYDVSYKLCMDKELLYRMYKSGKQFEYIDENLTKYRAGGVSDKRAIDVYKEGSRMALAYGEPRAKVWLIQNKKIVRKKIATICKRLPIYKRWKKAN